MHLGTKPAYLITHKGEQVLLPKERDQLPPKHFPN